MVAIFGICVFVWIIAGLLGMEYHLANKRGINWFGLLYFTGFPFIPLLAYWCGLI